MTDNRRLYWIPAAAVSDPAADPAAAPGLPPFCLSLGADQDAVRVGVWTGEHESVCSLDPDRAAAYARALEAAAGRADAIRIPFDDTDVLLAAAAARTAAGHLHDLSDRCRPRPAAVRIPRPRRADAAAHAAA